MGVNVSAVEAAIRARVEAQLAAVGGVAEAQAALDRIDEERAEAVRAYALAWAEAVKVEVPEADLRRGGYVAPEVPAPKKKKRAPRARAVVDGGAERAAVEAAAQ